GAEIIISKTELIIGEAEITVSKAKAIICAPDLIIGVTNKIISAPLCSRSILARDASSSAEVCTTPSAKHVSVAPFSGFFLKRRGVMTRNGAQPELPALLSRWWIVDQSARNSESRRGRSWKGFVPFFGYCCPP